jgi:hypothetical protein
MLRPQFSVFSASSVLINLGVCSSADVNDGLVEPLSPPRSRPIWAQDTISAANHSSLGPVSQTNVLVIVLRR